MPEFGFGLSLVTITNNIKSRMKTKQTPANKNLVKLVPAHAAGWVVLSLT
jgi:hypothetical protein